MLNFYIHKQSVDLSEDRVVHFLEVFKISLYLAQVSVYRGHLVPHVVLWKFKNFTKMFQIFSYQKIQKSQIYLC